MLPRNHPDRIQIAFDDHRLVANAGLLLPVTLAELPTLLDRAKLELPTPGGWCGAWPRSGIARGLHRARQMAAREPINWDFPYWQSSDSKGSPNEMVAS